MANEKSMVPPAHRSNACFRHRIILNICGINIQHITIILNTTNTVALFDLIYIDH